MSDTPKPQNRKLLIGKIGVLVAAVLAGLTVAFPQHAEDFQKIGAGIAALLAFITQQIVKEDTTHAQIRADLRAVELNAGTEQYAIAVQNTAPITKEVTQ